MGVANCDVGNGTVGSVMGPVTPNLDLKYYGCSCQQLKFNTDVEIVVIIRFLNGLDGGGGNMTWIA